MGQYYYYGPQQQMYAGQAVSQDHQLHSGQVSQVMNNSSVPAPASSESVPLVANKYALPGDDVPGGLRKV